MSRLNLNHGPAFNVASIRATSPKRPIPSLWAPSSASGSNTSTRVSFVLKGSRTGRVPPTSVSVRGCRTVHAGPGRDGVPYRPTEDGGRLGHSGSWSFPLGRGRVLPPLYLQGSPRRSGVKVPPGELTLVPRKTVFPVGDLPTPLTNEDLKRHDSGETRLFSQHKDVANGRKRNTEDKTTTLLSSERGGSSSPSDRRGLRPLRRRRREDEPPTLLCRSPSPRDRSVCSLDVCGPGPQAQDTQDAGGSDECLYSPVRGGSW